MNSLVFVGSNGRTNRPYVVSKYPLEYFCETYLAAVAISSYVLRVLKHQQIYTIEQARGHEVTRSRRVAIGSRGDVSVMALVGDT